MHIATARLLTISTAVAFFALNLPPPASAASARWPDEAVYTLSLKFNKEPNSLTGAGTISFENTGTATIDTVWLRLWPNGLGSCKKPLTTVSILSGARAGRYRTGCSALEVKLDAPIQPAARATFGFSFRTDVPKRRKDIITERLGPSGKAMMIGNAIPVLAVTDDDGLHLERYSEYGESFYSLDSKWDVTLDVPKGLEAASTGTELSRETLSGGRTKLTLRTEHARDFGLAIGRYKVFKISHLGINIRYFKQPGGPSVDEEGAKAVLRYARKALSQYTKHYGPYGSTELDLAGAPLGPAMEYPEMVMTPGEQLAVVHEIGHQWWYAIVGNNQWKEPWLDEGFTSFSEALAIGRHPSKMECKGVLAPNLGVRLDITMKKIDSNSEFMMVPYSSGACALEELRRGIGDDLFYDLLKDLQNDYRYGVATTREFIDAARFAASPTPFKFDRWLKKVGLS